MEFKRELNLSERYGKIRTEEHYPFASIVTTSKTFTVCFVKDENGNFIEREFGWELPMAIRILNRSNKSMRENYTFSFVIDLAVAIYYDNVYGNTGLVDFATLFERVGKGRINAEEYIKKRREEYERHSTINFIERATSKSMTVESTVSIDVKYMVSYIRNLPCIIHDKLKACLVVETDKVGDYAKVHKIGNIFVLSIYKGNRNVAIYRRDSTERTPQALANKIQYTFPKSKKNKKWK